MDKRELLDRYEARGDDETYRDALREYEDALAEDPENAALLHDYGYLQECRGRRMLEAAVACYERAIELDPDREKSRLQLIHAQAALGRHDEAIARHRRQLAEVPDSLSEHRLLAYAHLTARDFAAAERVIRAGLELAPDDARLVVLGGDVLAGTSQHPEALAAWQRALELNPDNQSPRYSRAFLLDATADSVKPPPSGGRSSTGHKRAATSRCRVAAPRARAPRSPPRHPGAIRIVRDAGCSQPVHSRATAR